MLQPPLAAPARGANRQERWRHGPLTACGGDSFFLRPTPCRKPTGMEYARALLRTTGSDCEDGVRADLSSLFERAGVDPGFQFLEGEFEGGRRSFQQAMLRKYVATKQGKQPTAATAARQPNPSRPGTAAAPPPLTADEISVLDAEAQVRGILWDPLPGH